METTKNKLITLFKQCCDNQNFPKKFINERSCGGGSFSEEKSPFEISETLTDALTNAGFTNFIKGKYYDTSDSAIFRKFNFDSEPPLTLNGACLSLTMNVDRKYIKLSEVLTQMSSDKIDIKVTKNNIFGRPVQKFVKTNVPHFYREANIDEEIFERKSNFDMSAFPEIYDSYISGIKSKMIFAKLHDNIHRADDTWSRGVNNFFTLSDTELIDDDKLFNHQTFTTTLRLKVGILKFGTIWVWVSYEELKELNAYYIESVEKSTLSLLDQRINETK